MVAPWSTCVDLTGERVKSTSVDMNRGDWGKETAATPPKHRRNAIVTRQAILESALIAFTRSGYNGVGVREIAKGARVTAMLVNRYFGSKERLFAEVVEVALAKRTILTEEATAPGRDLTTLSRDAAVALVARMTLEDQPLDGFLVMLRSISNERAAAIWREKIEQTFEKPLAALLPGAEANERAALFQCLIAGFYLMRKVIGSRALAAADTAALSRRLAALFQVLVEPNPYPAAGRKPARPSARKSKS
jgi:AcrR family transcriptional regulator